MSTIESGAYHIVIPARYASERLPGKVLQDLAGIPLLQHVWQRACESAAQSVIIDPVNVAGANSGQSAPYPGTVSAQVLSVHVCIPLA